MKTTAIITAILMVLVGVTLFSLQISDESESAGSVATVTYNIDSECGTNNPINPTSYSGGSVVLEDAIPNAGYRFAGWYVLTGIWVQNYAQISNLSEIGVRNVTLYALWEFELDITYDMGGAPADGTLPGKMWSNSIVSPDIPVWGDRSFYRWTYSDLQADNAYLTVGNTGLLTMHANAGSVKFNAGWYYSISYDPAGGTILGDEVTAYHDGENKYLPSAARDGYYFNGWVIDGDHSKRIESITSDLSGDLDLTPWWISISDIVGHNYTLDYNVRASQGPYHTDYSGTYTNYVYSYDTERGFYTVHVEGSESSAYWSDENASDHVYTYLGMENYPLNGNDYLCEVYTTNSLTYSETQYIYAGWIPVFIEFREYRSGIWYEGTYSLVSTEPFDIRGTKDVKGYGDHGIIVSGSGTYSIASQATLTATAGDGTEFSGWYNSSGQLLCSTAVYTFTVYADTVVYALNNTDPDFTVPYNDEFRFPGYDGAVVNEWVVISRSTGDTERSDTSSFSMVFEHGGEYEIYFTATIGSETIYGFYTLLADGNVIRTFEWTVGKENYSVTLDIAYSDYLAYHTDGSSRTDPSYSVLSGKVTSDDCYVVQIARYIMDVTKGMTQAERMAVLLSFVENIEYMFDSDSTGQDEYFKYPLETLYDMNGDCEDTSILFSAVASAMGYRSALLLFEGHMASSIEITDGSVKTANPAIFTRDKVTYYYCETTTTGWKIGQAPDGYTYGGRYYTYPDSKAIMPIASNYGLTDIDMVDGTASISFTDISESIENSKPLKIKSDEVSIEFDDDVLRYLKETYGTDMELKFSKVDVSKLEEQKVALVEGMSVYSFELLSGDTSVTTFGGNLRIVLGYDAEPSKNISAVRVYCLNGDHLEDIETVSFANGNVVFLAPHFSMFAVSVEYGDSPSILPFAIIILLAAAIVAVSMVIWRRRRVSEM